MSIQSTSSDTYTFTLTAGGPWSGTNTANVVRDTNPSLLTVTGTGKAAFNTISITDSAAAAGVMFANSGTNAYSDNFSIDLVNASTTVTFQGNSSFGTSNLTVLTVGNIVLSGASPVAQISVSDGNVTLSANSAGTATGSFTGIRLSGASSITSMGTGNISLTGRGAGTAANTLGISVETGAMIQSTATAAGAGTITLEGTGGTGTVSNDGVRVSGTNSSVKSAGGAIQITGTAPVSGVGVNLQIKQAVWSTGTANVSLIADGLNLTGASPVVAAAASSVVLRPKTAGTLIDLGGTDVSGMLGLTDTELDRITAGTVQIGDASSGAITVTAPLTHPNNLVLATGAGLTINQRITVSNKTLTLRTGVVTSAPGDVVDIDAGTLWLDTQAAVGASGNPLTVLLDNLRGTAGGDLFVAYGGYAFNSVIISGALSAGTNTIHFVGGKFSLGASDLIDDNSYVNVNGSTFDLGSKNDTVGGVTLTTGQITASGVLTGKTTFQVESGTISAKLGGSVGLNKTTSGTATLSGDNSYTGATTIVGGVLSVNKDIGLGTPPASPTPNHLVIDGGTLSWTAISSLSLSSNRGLALGGVSAPGTGTIEVAGGELTYNGVIANRGTGTGQLVKTGLQPLTLGGVNTYSGGTVIDRGELRINSDRSLGAVPASPTPGHLQLRGVLVARDASFEIAANRGMVLGDLDGSGSGTISVPTSLTVTYDGKIADNGTGPDSLIKLGEGKLVLGGDSTFSGGTDYLDECTIRIDHENGLGVGEIRFGTKATLQYGVGVTKDLSGRLSSWDASVKVTIDTNGNDVVFASPFSTDGILVKQGEGTLRLDNQGTPLEETRISVLYVEGGELAVTAGTLHLTGGKSPDVLGIAYTDLTSLFVKDAMVTIAGGTVVTEESLLVGFVLDAALSVTSGRLEVQGDLVAGSSADGTVNISGDSNVRVIVKGDLIGGFRGGGSGEISGGITQIEGHLIAGKDGTWTVNVSGGTVNATSLRHLGGDDGVVKLSGGLVDVHEVVHETANNTSNDSLRIDLDAGGTLITDRMYLNWTGGTPANFTHTFAVNFDGGTLQPKSDGNLIDAFTGQNLIWQGELEDGGTLKEGAAIIDTNGFDVNIRQPLTHDLDLVNIRDGGLTKRGVGTLTLSAVNTFTGPVTVEGGTLALVNDKSDNPIRSANLIDVQFDTALDVTGLKGESTTGTLALAGRQTLMGEGTVTGHLIAFDGSTVAPGPGPGILSQVGNFEMTSGSTAGDRHRRRRGRVWQQ